MKRIGKFQVIDHGVQYAQYFQGQGTAHTGFHFAATGVGDTPDEAVNDLAESIAQMSFNTKTLRARIHQAHEFPNVSAAKEDRDNTEGGPQEPNPGDFPYTDEGEAAYEAAQDDHEEALEAFEQDLAESSEANYTVSLLCNERPK